MRPPPLTSSTLLSQVPTRLRFLPLPATSYDGPCPSRPPSSNLPWIPFLQVAADACHHHGCCHSRRDGAAPPLILVPPFSWLGLPTHWPLLDTRRGRKFVRASAPHTGRVLGCTAWLPPGGEGAGSGARDHRWGKELVARATPVSKARVYGHSLADGK